MSAGKLDLIVEQWATLELPITWLDQNRAPINLLGWSARLQIRAKVGGAVLVTLVSPTNITLGTDGTISVEIPSGTTGTLNFTNGVYDLLLTAPSGKKKRLIEGKITFSPAVTVP
jgi:hypothetical protein